MAHSLYESLNLSKYENMIFLPFLAVLLVILVINPQCLSLPERNLRWYRFDHMIT